MAKTWSSPKRKDFGVKKTHEHRQRSKWGQKNQGWRLRTLSADLSDFKEEKKKDPSSEEATASLAVEMIGLHIKGEKTKKDLKEFRTSLLKKARTLLKCQKEAESPEAAANIKAERICTIREAEVLLTYIKSGIT